jgi:hypothetical protein
VLVSLAAQDGRGRQAYPMAVKIMNELVVVSHGGLNPTILGQAQAFAAPLSAH